MDTMELNITEVKIGNLVNAIERGKDDNDILEEVVIWSIEKNKYRDWINGENIDFFLPILLTEAQLEELGFKLGYKSFHEHITIYTKDRVRVINSPAGDGWFLDTSDKAIDVRLESVHQMQNLYFVLMNEELTKQKQNDIEANKL